MFWLITAKNRLELILITCTLSCSVYTSGSGGIFKAGIPIGKIKNIPGVEIGVDFFSDFTQLKFVKIVSFQKEEN